MTTSTNTNEANYKVRFAPGNTAEGINDILDAIDANAGYCPCQRPSAASICPCEDFRGEKQIGEPCICGLYIKQAK